MVRYLGVDVAGASNTWMATLTERGGQITDVSVAKTTLANVLRECQTEDVMALAIDAQLTFALSRENGFRVSDERLRELIGAEFRHRVASYNSLMAVPLRGTALATAVSPFVGTIIETHPTASMLLALSDQDVRGAVKAYKRGRKGEESAAAHSEECRNSCQFLWDAWMARFSLPAAPPEEMSDGAVDAVVTATVAWLYHRAPEQLCKLATGESDEVGRGPFWVIKPEGAPPAH